MRDSPADRSALASIVVADQIGIGLVLNGRLFATRQPGEGDLTHIAPGTPGPTCPECGRMCLRRQVMALGTGLTPESCESAAAALAAVTAPVIATVGLQEVVLATAIPEETCRKIGLGYLDPATVRIDDYMNREEEGILFVDHAGETLYRVAGGR